VEAYLRRTAMWYGGVGLLTAQVLRSLALPPKYFKLVANEIEIQGVRSLGVALTAAIFTGMVFALQSAVNMARFGAESYVGPVAALAILRELGPVLTAILVGGKVASGITAELGSMRVTEQIDALQTFGTDPIKKLVTPRVLAGVLMLPLLTVITDVVGVLGGMLISVLRVGITADTFVQGVLNTLAESGFVMGIIPKDFIAGLLKPFVFGGIITLTACYFGLNTQGGTEGVGTAATRAVVACSVLILATDYFLTQLLLVVLNPN
jgi:phospholipid/cholesterol/gamma-HCH transport system permease protein